MKIRLADYPPPFSEALAAFEALRRLGFESENIFTAHDVHSNLVVVLKADNKDFGIVCGPIYEDEQVVMTKWVGIAHAILEMRLDEDELQNAYEASFVRRNAVGLVTALNAKGIRIPNVVKKLN